MKWSTEKKIFVGVGVALAVLLINALISNRATRRLIGHEQLVSHTHQVLTELEATMSTMKDAETGERGYLITGEGAYLDPYQAAINEINDRVEKLRQLTADNPNQQARIPVLESKIANRLDTLKRQIDLRKSGNAEGTRQVILSGVGKRLMDDLRQYINEMEGEENELLRRRSEEAKASGGDAFFTFWIANLIACALVSLIAYIIIRDIAARKRAEEALRQQREWLQVTLSSIGDAVIATNSEGSINFMNMVAQSLTGWKPEEAQEQPLESVFNIVSEQTREPVDNPALRAIKEGAIFGLANHTVLISKDGTETPIDDSGAPIRDSEGRILGAVLIFRDITERRRAEQTRTQLASIVESSEDAIISKDLDGFITSWNAGAERIFGYTAAEALGQPITIIVPPGRFEEEQSIIEVLQQGERVQHFETVRLPKSGKAIDISLTISPVRDPAGQIIGASKIARDITARKHSEQELLESRERLRMAMEASQMGTWTRELDETNRTRWSPELEQIFGLNPGEFQETEEAFFNLVHPDDRELIGEAVREAIENHTDYLVEFRYTRKGGGLRWMVGRGRAFYDAAGRPFRLAGLGWDITERKRAEEELRQQREWLRVTLSSIGDAVIATDTSGAITFLNPVAQSLTGWKQEEAKGQYLERVFSIVNEQTRTPVENPALRAMKEGIIVGLANHTVLIAKDGTEIPIDDSGAPITDSGGKVLGSVLIFRDITERRRAEKDRSQLLASERVAREHAEAASRAKDEFVAMVSHEIRSPLNAILGWTHMLRTGKLDQTEATHALEAVERAAKAQVQLIDDLLDISRVITGKLILSVRPVELSHIIEAVIDSIRPAADAKCIRVECHTDPRGSWVSGDPNRLQQIIWNLLSNAIKFTPRNGHIAVNVERIDSHVEVTVSDSGAGITPEFLPYVFDRFRQASTTTERKHGGLGLGLAIVRHLVESHGGTVRAASPGGGKGATFSVTLPMIAVNDERSEFKRTYPTAADASLVDEVMLDGLRVMIVDDDTDTRDLLTAVLTGSGAAVRACASASEALEAIQHWRPFVLISDIGMPDEDGYSLIRKLRGLEPERGGNIPAVALTGYARSDDRMRALAAGFQTHVTKPIEPDELIIVIASLAGRTGKRMDA